MNLSQLAGSIRPASPEEATLLREVVELYGLALDGHFHLLPALQEKGQRLSPATLLALDAALRPAARTRPGWDAVRLDLRSRAPRPGPLLMN